MIKDSEELRKQLEKIRDKNHTYTFFTTPKKRN